MVDGKRGLGGVGLLAAAVILVVNSCVNPPSTDDTPCIQRVSVGPGGVQGDSGSEMPAISADGRYVAFASIATNLVAGDTNNAEDVFLCDRDTGGVQRVSVNTSGAEGNSHSFAPAISADGRYVAFASLATNLVAGDTNGVWDVFVHDRQTGATERVSVDSAGSQGNGDSESPAISADGRYVAFASRATNLVAGDTNGRWDVFVHDRQTGTTERVSVDSAGSQGNGDSESPAISADGRYVAFHSDATSLVDGDTNSQRDVFVHDRQTSATERVSISSVGSEGDDTSGYPAISADGRYVAFTSLAKNLVEDDTNFQWDIFLHDRQTGATERVSVDSAEAQSDGSSESSAISGNGRYVIFASEATNLVAGDANGCRDIFVRDRQTGTTMRVSVSATGSEGDERSDMPAISADGRHVAFASFATNLVAGDTNNEWDVFVSPLQ